MATSRSQCGPHPRRIIDSPSAVQRLPVVAHIVSGLLLVKEVLYLHAKYRAAQVGERRRELVAMAPLIPANCAPGPQEILMVRIAWRG